MNTDHSIRVQLHKAFTITKEEIENIVELLSVSTLN